MSWNGLSFTAAAEMSGRERAGTAIGVQNTILDGAAARSRRWPSPAVVDATSWPVAWALLAAFAAGRGGGAGAAGGRGARAPGGPRARVLRSRARRTCQRFPGSTRHDTEHDMNDEVQSGLEGVVAFATEIAEPDKEGGALRYRGVDIEDLVGRCRSRRSGGCSSTARSSRAWPRPSRIR